MPPVQLQTDKPINATSTSGDGAVLDSTSAATSNLTPAEPASVAQLRPTPATIENVADNGGSPPPPQPGATPIPFSPSSHVPADASPHSPQPRAVPAQQPAQPPPFGNTSSKVTSQQPMSTASTGILPPTLSHPPGYQQDTSFNEPYAPSESTSTAVRETGMSAGTGAVLPLGGNTNSKGGAGDLQEQAGDAWKAVKGWAGTAATKVGEVEGNVWRWIDGKRGQ